MRFDIGDILSSGSDWLQKGNNPYLTAIALDKLGQGFDANNPAAGIGTLLGQGGIANVARKEQMQNQKDIMAEFARILSGAQGMNKLTPAGTPGYSKGTVTAPTEEGGNPTFRLEGDLGGMQSINQPKNVSIGDYLGGGYVPF